MMSTAFIEFKTSNDDRVPRLRAVFVALQKAKALTIGKPGNTGGRVLVIR
jgi:hypothetical protein